LQGLSKSRRESRRGERTYRKKMPVTDLASLRLQMVVLGETGVLSPDCDLRVDPEVDVDDDEPESRPNPMRFQVLQPHPTSSTWGTGCPRVPAWDKTTLVRKRALCNSITSDLNWFSSTLHPISFTDPCCAVSIDSILHRLGWTSQPKSVSMNDLAGCL